MKLVFLYGPPACGKLTVGRELAALTGFKLFHNHLVVDALGAVFDFGSGPFVELRERVWLDVMGTAAESGLDGLIFTFAPERTVRADFPERLQSSLNAAGAELIFVELTCSAAEIERRLTADSRQQHGKLTSVELYRQLAADGAFDTPVMPAPRLTVDTEAHEPRAGAALIAAELGLS